MLVEIIIIIIEWEETLEGDEYVYGLNDDDGFLNVFLSPNSASCIR